MLDSIEEELEAQLAQISWANDCIEKLQEDIVIFEDTKVPHVIRSWKTYLLFSLRWKVIPSML